jgi:LPXTG-motif cell wall-anchored protein
VDAVIKDIVPGQVTVTGVTSAQFSCSNSGNTVTCTKPSMAVGETGSISIAVTVPAAAASGTVTNIGSVTATTPDNNPSNNSDDAAVTIVAQAPPLPPPPPVVLPPTGSNSTTPVTWAAISLVLLGGLVMLISRRRRDHTSVN